MFVEQLEHAAQKSVLEQHFAGRDTQNRRVPLGGDGGDRTPRRIECDARSVGARVAGIVDPDRNPQSHGRRDGCRMQYLGAEAGELAGLIEANLFDRAGRWHHSRIRRQHAVDVGPDLDRAGLQRGANE